MDDLDYVNGMWDDSSVFTDQQVSQWAQNEALANGRHITERKAGRSSIFVPKIPSYVKRKLADFVGQFIGDKPVSIKSTLTSDPVGAKIRQNVHNHYLATALEYDSLVYNAGYCGLVYNYAPIYLDWIETTTTQKQVQQTGMPDGSIVSEEVEIETVIESHPTASVLPPEDVRIDPSASWDNIDESRYIGFRVFMSSADAEDMYEKGKWPKIDENTSNMGNASTNANILSNERRSPNSPFNSSSSIDLDNDLLEIRYHFYFQEGKDGFTPVRCVTLGDLQELEEPAELNIAWGGDKHAWPFVLGQINPKPFEQHAPALPEQGKDLQIEVNAIRNQRRDNVALILNPEKYVTPHAGVTPAQLSFSYPGKIVSVDNLNAVQWQTVPDVTASGHNEETRVEGDMDRLFSEGPMRMGQSGKRKESATAIQQMSQNASANTGLDTTLLMLSAIRPFHEKLGHAISQKAPESLYHLAAREIGVSPNIDPYLAAVQGEFIYNVYATSMQNDVANELANVSNIIGLLMSTYGPQANYKPLADKLLETAGYDPDMIVPNPMQTGMANQAAMDAGGVDPQGKSSIQPRAQFQGGGAMASGSGNQ